MGATRFFQGCLGLIIEKRYFAINCFSLFVIEGFLDDHCNRTYMISPDQPSQIGTHMDEPLELQNGLYFVFVNKIV